MQDKEEDKKGERLIWLGKKSASKVLLAMLLVLLLALAACNKTEDAKPADSGKRRQISRKKKQKRKRVAKNSILSMILLILKQMKVKQSKAVRLHYGLVSDTAFEGTLNFNFYSGAPDSEVL